MTICKFFIISDLDYGNKVYDQAYNASFQQKLESSKYNAALPTAAAIHAISKEKSYEELGLASGT